MKAQEERALRKQVALVNLVTDMQYLARAIYDIAACRPNSVHVSTSIIPLAALLVYEAAGHIRKREPEYSELADLVSSPELTEARHSVKLFDGDSYRVAGVNVLFEDGFLVEDKLHFIDSIRFRFARPLGVDLGLTFLDSKLICTTHALQFNLGLAQGAAYQEDAGRKLMELAQQVGAFASAIARSTGVDSPGESFVADYPDDRFHLRDVVAAKFYGRLGDPALPLGASASLAAICGTMNFLDQVVGSDRSEINGPTATKLHYVVLWHVIRGLELIHASNIAALQGSSRDILTRTLNLGDAARIFDDSERRLRNALVHYGLTKHYPAATLAPGTPLSGLVETIYPDLTFADFQGLIYSTTSNISESLNEWLAVSPSVGRPAER